MNICLFLFQLVERFQSPNHNNQGEGGHSGRAFGVWYDNTNTFQFKLPAGVCSCLLKLWD